MEITLEHCNWAYVRISVCDWYPGSFPELVSLARLDKDLHVFNVKNNVAFPQGCQFTQPEKASITQQTDCHCANDRQLSSRRSKFHKHPMENFGSNGLLLHCFVSQDLLGTSQDLFNKWMISRIFHYSQLVCPGNGINRFLHRCTGLGRLDQKGQIQGKLKGFAGKALMPGFDLAHFFHLLKPPAYFLTVAGALLQRAKEGRDAPNSYFGLSIFCISVQIPLEKTSGRVQ